MRIEDNPLKPEILGAILQEDFITSSGVRRLCTKKIFSSCKYRTTGISSNTVRVQIFSLFDPIVHKE